MRSGMRSHPHGGMGAAPAQRKTPSPPQRQQHPLVSADFGFYGYYNNCFDHYRFF